MHRLGRTDRVGFASVTVSGHVTVHTFGVSSAESGGTDAPFTLITRAAGVPVNINRAAMAHRGAKARANGYTCSIDATDAHAYLLNRMANACQALAAFSYPHGIRRSLLFAYVQRLRLDDERLARLARAGDGLRSIYDPTYHAVRWPSPDGPEATFEALVREAEEYQATSETAPTSPPRRTPARRLRQRHRRRPRAALPPRLHSEIIWPDLTTARRTPHVIAPPTAR